MRTAQVVPDLATFAVDDGFSYAVPNGLDVRVGSLVRVPLGSRRLRGFVVAVHRGDPTGLRDVAAVSGDLPVFDGSLLQTLRWAALHYVAPLSVVLGKAAPPNLPRLPAHRQRAPLPGGVGSGLEGAVATGSRIQPAHLTAIDDERLVALITAALTGERSALVVVPTVAEGTAAVSMLATAFGDRVAAAWSQASGADVTRAWGRLATPTGSVLVATREAMWWPMAAPGGAVVLGEGRRAMKDRQTPTVHVRDVLRRRGAVERFPVISTGAVPTAETVAAGVEIMAVAGRTWPLAEIVDRTEEPPGSGTVTTRARNALRVAARGGGRGFVLCPHRGNSVRCVRCRSLRQCQVCATSLGRDDVCSRCGASGGPCAQCGANHFEAASTSVGRVITELGSVVGSAVGEAGSARPITVGTERDMPLSGSVDIAVAVDGDAAVFAANYRAAEDALRLLARLATSVRRGRTNRTLVQTSRAGHAVYEALRRGSAADFMAAEVARRRQDGFPPAGELVAVEVRDPVGAIAADLEEAVAGDGVVMGPAPVGERMRWLIQGGDLRRAKVALRPMVQSWRESGARVRIDVDPIDL